MEVKKVKELLPIGTVVLLKNATKRLMICGRIQTDVSTDTVYDYSSCYYPEGIINSREMFMFNNEDIERVYFIGFQDEEEFEFRQFINKKLSDKKTD